MKGCRGQGDKPSFIESVSAWHVNKWEMAPMPQAPHLRTFCIHSSFVWALEITWNIISSVKWVACFSEVDGWGVRERGEREGGRFARVDFNPLWYTWRSREAENTSFDDSRLELVNKHVQTRFDIPSLHVGIHIHTAFHLWTNPGIRNTCDVCSYQRVERKKGRNDSITMAIYFLVYFPFFFPLTRAYSFLLYTFYAVV